MIFVNLLSVHGYTVYAWKVNLCSWKKKQKKLTRALHADPNRTIVWNNIYDLKTNCKTEIVLSLTTNELLVSTLKNLISLMPSISFKHHFRIFNLIISFFGNILVHKTMKCLIGPKTHKSIDIKLRLYVDQVYELSYWFNKWVNNRIARWNKKILKF